MLRRALIVCAIVCVSEFSFASFGLADDLSRAILAKYGNANGELDDAGMRRLLTDLRAPHMARRAGGGHVVWSASDRAINAATGSQSPSATASTAARSG